MKKNQIFNKKFKNKFKNNRMMRLRYLKKIMIIN